MSRGGATSVGKVGWGRVKETDTRNLLDEKNKILIVFTLKTLVLPCCQGKEDKWFNQLHSITPPPYGEPLPTTHIRY